MRSKVLCVIVIAIISIAGYVHAESDSVKVVDYALTSGDLSQTSRTILEAVKVDLQKGQNENALNKLDTLINSEPDNYGPLSVYVLICMENSWWKRAIEPAKKMAILRPDDTSYLGLGQVYGGANMLPEAIDALKKAVELNPNNIGAHEFLGTAYGEMGNKEDAEKEYEILKKVDFQASMRVLRVIKTGKAQR